MNNDVVLGSNETGELNDELNGEIIFQIEPIMNEMLLKIVSDMNKTPNSFLNDSSCFAGDSTPNQFSLVNTCDSCATQDSVFWRRVARTKIVCNKCFFSQIYLLLFKETKENHETSPQQLPDQDEQEQPVRKKKRASIKNNSQSSLSRLKSQSEKKRKSRNGRKSKKKKKKERTKTRNNREKDYAEHLYFRTTTLNDKTISFEIQNQYRPPLSDVVFPIIVASALAACQLVCSHMPVKLKRKQILS